jgi:hypothetical protein
MWPTGIAISHFYRMLIIKFDWLQKQIVWQLITIIVMSIANGLLYFIIDFLLLKILSLSVVKLDFITVAELVINFSVVFVIWSIIYFGFHFFQNYKLSEINALKYLAANKESELNNLKAQLNPHFIFNCMNSIRALVDENPDKAKLAITQLSNILRNTLLIDKNKEILLSDEIKLVEDYLQLEKIRYEERLHYTLNIDAHTLKQFIPPFIIQSQVENAIKHGISKLSNGGNILVETLIQNQFLKIKISNTGKLNNQKPLTGVGFVNSKQRLEMLYGTRSKIWIEENQNNVIVQIEIPLQKN